MTDILELLGGCGSCDSLKAKIQDLERKFETKKKLVVTLKEVLRKKDLEIDSRKKENDVNVINEQISVFRNKLHESNALVARYSETIEELKERNKRLEESVDSLEGARSGLEVQVKQLIEDCDEKLVKLKKYELKKYERKETQKASFKGKTRRKQAVQEIESACEFEKSDTDIDSELTLNDESIDDVTTSTETRSSSLAPVFHVATSSQESDRLRLSESPKNDGGRKKEISSKNRLLIPIKNTREGFVSASEEMETSDSILSPPKPPLLNDERSELSFEFEDVQLEADNHVKLCKHDKSLSHFTKEDNFTNFRGLDHGSVLTPNLLDHNYSFCGEPSVALSDQRCFSTLYEVHVAKETVSLCNHSVGQLDGSSHLPLIEDPISLLDDTGKEIYFPSEKLAEIGGIINTLIASETVVVEDSCGSSMNHDDAEGLMKEIARPNTPPTEIPCSPFDFISSPMKSTRALETKNDPSFEVEVKKTASIQNDSPRASGSDTCTKAVLTYESPFNSSSLFDLPEDCLGRNSVLSPLEPVDLGETNKYEIVVNRAVSSRNDSFQKCTSSNLLNEEGANGCENDIDEETASRIDFVPCLISPIKARSHFKKLSASVESSSVQTELRNYSKETQVKTVSVDVMSEAKVNCEEFGVQANLIDEPRNINPRLHADHSSQTEAVILKTAETQVDCTSENNTVNRSSQMFDAIYDVKIEYTNKSCSFYNNPFKRSCWRTEALGTAHQIFSGNTLFAERLSSVVSGEMASKKRPLLTPALLKIESNSVGDSPSLKKSRRDCQLSEIDEANLCNVITRLQLSDLKREFSRCGDCENRLEPVFGKVEFSPVQPASGKEFTPAQYSRVFGSFGEKNDLLDFNCKRRECIPSPSVMFEGYRTSVPKKSDEFTGEGSLNERIRSPDHKTVPPVHNYVNTRSSVRRSSTSVDDIAFLPEKTVIDIPVNNPNVLESRSPLKCTTVPKSNLKSSGSAEFDKPLETVSGLDSNNRTKFVNVAFTPESDIQSNHSSPQPSCLPKNPGQARPDETCKSSPGAEARLIKSNGIKVDRASVNQKSRICEPKLPQRQSFSTGMHESVNNSEVPTCVKVGNSTSPSRKEPVFKVPSNGPFVRKTNKKHSKSAKKRKKSPLIENCRNHAPSLPSANKSAEIDNVFKFLREEVAFLDFKLLSPLPASPEPLDEENADNFCAREMESVDYYSRGGTQATKNLEVSAEILDNSKCCSSSNKKNTIEVDDQCRFTSDKIVVEEVYSKKDPATSFLASKTKDDVENKRFETERHLFSSGNGKERLISNSTVARTSLEMSLDSVAFMPLPSSENLSLAGCKESESMINPEESSKKYLEETMVPEIEVPSCRKVSSLIPQPSTSRSRDGEIRQENHADGNCKDPFPVITPTRSSFPKMPLDSAAFTSLPSTENLSFADSRESKSFFNLEELPKKYLEKTIAEIEVTSNSKAASFNPQPGTSRSSDRMVGLKNHGRMELNQLATFFNRRTPVEVESTGFNFSSTSHVELESLAQKNELMNDNLEESELSDCSEDNLVIDEGFVVVNDDEGGDPAAEEAWLKKCGDVDIKPTGFYVEIEEEVKAKEVESPKSSAEQPNVGVTSLEQIVEEDDEEVESIPCESDALHSSMIYWYQKVADGSLTPDTKKLSPANTTINKIDTKLDSFCTKGSSATPRSMAYVLRVYNQEDVSRCIIKQILKAESEEPGGKISPLRHRLLSLVIVLTERESPFLDKFLDSAAHKVASVKDKTMTIDDCIKLATFYCQLCQLYILKARMVSFLVDIIYAKGNKAPHIVFSLLKMWPNLLPHFKRSRGDLLTMSVVQALCLPRKGNLTPMQKILRKCLLKNYGYYQVESMDQTQFVEDLLSNLTVAQNELAALVYCKSRGWEFTLDIMNVRIIPRLSGWISGERSYSDLQLSKLIILLGLLSKNIPPCAPTSPINKSLEVLEKILFKATKFLVIDAAIEAICHFRRHNTCKCAKILANWTPPNKSISLRALSSIWLLLREKRSKFWIDFF